MKNEERKMKNIALAGTMLLAAVLTTGCRKDLCFDHDEHALTVKTDIAADWEQEWERPYDMDWQGTWDELLMGRPYDDLRPEAAAGIRALVYSDGELIAENNLPATGGRLPLNEGTFDLLFYNNDTEYILIDNSTTAVATRATTRTLTRNGFMELHEGERTVNQPDMLYGHYLEDHITERTLEPVSLPVQMHPLVYTYLIRYEFESGLEYVALTRGALAGMAESVYLSDGHTGNEAATVMFDCELTPWGAEALVKSFGVPNYPGDHYTRADGSAATYAVSLDVRLNNGKIITYEFDVTDQVEKQPRGGVITVTGIVVDKEDGEEGSGGFNPSVDGWGEYHDITLPID